MHSEARFHVRWTQSWILSPIPGALPPDRGGHWFRASVRRSDNARKSASDRLVSSDPRRKLRGNLLPCGRRRQGRNPRQALVHGLPPCCGRSNGGDDYGSIRRRRCGTRPRIGALQSRPSRRPWTRPAGRHSTRPRRSGNREKPTGVHRRGTRANHCRFSDKEALRRADCRGPSHHVWKGQAGAQVRQTDLQRRWVPPLE